MSNTDYLILSGYLHMLLYDAHLSPQHKHNLEYKAQQLIHILCA